MFEITTEVQFSAAHRLKNYHGPCENLHGHNWLVRATVKCTTLDQSGIGIDFKILKNNLKQIVEEFDHKDLNAVLGDLNPSSENIARLIYSRLKRSLADWDGSVSRVEVYETPGNCAAYYE
ncbi:MAG TPA: 6-carboxytetrahydropterin synthase QueD [Chitinispirillaceae bacterium]|jgi:6-pyruvoyltetrahydropterin/6-carboxytetrahydropterin synthase|nr:6-carboxytetrahydropterin synthase QueD [Chitinispirillaceae bacterium]